MRDRATHELAIYKMVLVMFSWLAARKLMRKEVENR